MSFAGSITLTQILGAGRHLPALGGVLMLVVGGAYLFFGRRLFRLLVVGAGAALGWELGRLVALHFGVSVPFIAAPVSLVLGGLSFSLWQAGVFLLGGVVGGVLGAEALSSTAGTEDLALWGGLAGLVLGGFLALMLVRAMSVGFTALVGAYLVYSSGLCLLPGLSFVRHLPQKPVFSLALIGILCLMGIVAQLASGDPDEMRLEREESRETRKKIRDEREAQNRWDRYLGR